jgi:hypothetical protein
VTVPPLTYAPDPTLVLSENVVELSFVIFHAPFAAVLPVTPEMTTRSLFPYV